MLPAGREKDNFVDDRVTCTENRRSPPYVQSADWSCHTAKNTASTHFATLVGLRFAGVRPAPPVGSSDQPTERALRCRSQKFPCGLVLALFPIPSGLQTTSAIGRKTFDKPVAPSSGRESVPRSSGPRGPWKVQSRNRHHSTHPHQTPHSSRRHSVHSSCGRPTTVEGSTDRWGRLSWRQVRGSTWVAD